MKNMIVFLGLLLCLCVSSWGACTSQTLTSNGYCATCNSGLANCGGCSPPSSCGDFSTYCSCSSGKFCSCGDLTYYCVSNYRWFANKVRITCDTQAEADSAAIAQKCTSGTMAKDTANGTIFDVCKNGEGLLISFNNPITGVRNSSIGYYIVTDGSADSLDEATYSHLAALACTEVSLYRGVLNGKYVYWYSTDPEPAGVVNVVRIK